MENDEIGVSEKAIAPAIIDDINGNTKPPFFPLYLRPYQVEFIDKHHKASGMGSRSAFVLAALDSYFTRGQFCYQRYTKDNEVLDVSMRGIANNLNQSVAALKSDKVAFEKRYGEEDYQRVLARLTEVQSLGLKVSKSLKDYTCVISSQMVHPEKPSEIGEIKKRPGRPRVLPSDVMERVKLFPTEEQIQRYREEMKKWGEKQLSAFLRRTLIEKASDRMFRYQKPKKIMDELQKKIRDLGLDFNDAVHEINHMRLINTFSWRSWEDWWWSLREVNRGLRELQAYIESEEDGDT